MGIDKENIGDCNQIYSIWNKAKIGTVPFKDVSMCREKEIWKEGPQFYFAVACLQEIRDVLMLQEWCRTNMFTTAWLRKAK